MLVLTILFIVMMLSSLSSSLRTHSRYRYKYLNNHLSTTILKSSTSSSDILNKNSNNDILNKIGAAGLAQAAQAAVVAASAVNQAVGMRDIQAPDVERTYVYRDGASENRIGVVDSVGLPLIYDKKIIEAYWKSQGSALTSRWTEFLGYAIPYLTRVITLLISGGSGELKKNGGVLAKDARIIFEKLGPTYIKMGQMMSVRPDVLPKEALDELKILQDSVKPFDTETAIKQIENELGGDLSQFFSEISIEPVAAASLAQVYKAKLIDSGEWVAVKVQRPAVLETVSKDLYVLRRAAEVYQGLTDRFAPQQKTNYVSLFNEWAVGFYTELDFLNEAANQQRLKELLIENKVSGVYVPTVYHSLCRRRVLVTEWIDGKKLSESPPNIIKELIVDAQEAFLIQLLQVGFFHSDPHPGNIMVMNTPRDSAKMALIDFGLVASIQQKDMDSMISAIIHLANKDYPSLVDDFIRLEILPSDCDRAKVIPLMDKAISPYVKGGGAQGYEKELKKIYGMDGTVSGTAGGFQQMTQDAITVLNDIPFSIPPYFALLGRAIVTLEGIALTGDPNYGIIQEAYPFVARKLLSEDRPEIQKALQEVLYAKGSNGDGFKAARLSVLLNSALGIVSRSDSFVDFDTIPEDSLKPGQLLKYLFSEKAASLRNLLTEEAVNAGDILLRQAARKSFISIVQRLPKLPFFSNIFPTPETIPLPFLIPKGPISTDLSKFDPSMFQVTLLQPNKVLEAAAPKLSLEEELYAISLTDLTKSTLGSDAAVISSGDVILDPTAATRFLLSVASTGKIQLISSSQSVDVSKQLLRLISPSLKTNEDNENEILKGMTEGLNDLNDDETKILQDTISNIVYRINEKVINRLQPLIL